MATQPTPTASNATDPPAGATATGLAVLDLIRAGDFPQIPAMFAPQLRPMVEAEALRAAWTAEITRHGQVTSVGAPISEPAGPGTAVVRIPLTYERGQLTLVISVAGGQWLTGLQLAPASAAQPTAPWEPPPYADPTTFDEQEVTLGSGPLAVPGILSRPRLAGPCPAVVLPAGSGPLDRDETIGRNKPFKDLAWGLASRGVAVLRFDKVTYAHRAQVTQLTDFTVAQEYLPAAVAAVELLQHEPAVAADGIFVLGHSLGGTIAARVAAAAPAVAGLVLLARRHSASALGRGPSGPLSGLPGPGHRRRRRPVLERMTRQARTVDSTELSPSTPVGDLPFSVPASYWLDLRGYDPGAATAGLGKPVLVLQGGRDYQVTVADDLARWEASLADRPDVTIRVYDADNHMFLSGSGPSTPAE